jgi:hypothetical protein
MTVGKLLLRCLTVSMTSPICAVPEIVSILLSSDFCPTTTPPRRAQCSHSKGIHFVEPVLYFSVCSIHEAFCTRLKSGAPCVSNWARTLDPDRAHTSLSQQVRDAFLTMTAIPHRFIGVPFLSVGDLGYPSSPHVFLTIVFLLSANS